MKKTGILGIAGLALVLACSNVNAQSTDSVRHRGMDRSKVGHHFEKGGKFNGGHHQMTHNAGLPNLTADQQKKIAALKTPYAKDLLPLKNQMAEKQAHLHTLQTADKADMGAINKTIDEMTALKAQMQKKSAAHREDIRKLLTDEQKVAFDSRGSKGTRHHGRHGQRN